jgi:8-oxo-dGTP diphosphatase
MDIKKFVRVGVGTMLLNEEGKILLGKRHNDPEKASSELHGEGTWTIPGGKMDFGDSIDGAAYREVLEETGIKINKNKLKIISIGNEALSDVHFVTIGFMCDDFEGEPQVLEPDEITEWRWFSFDNLPEKIFPPSHKMIKNYLDGTIFKY